MKDSPSFGDIRYLIFILNQTVSSGERGENPLRARHCEHAVSMQARVPEETQEKNFEDQVILFIKRSELCQLI